MRHLPLGRYQVTLQTWAEVGSKRKGVSMSTWDYT